MHARIIGIGIGLAALTALGGSAVVATGKAGTEETSAIVACQKRSGGFLRVVASASECTHGDSVLTWNVAGAAGPPGPAGSPGPQGPPGPASLTALQGTVCTRADGTPGTLAVATTAANLVELRCEDQGGPPPPPPTSSQLVVNEIDYDQVGTDADGFVEIANRGESAATLDDIDVVLVNGGDGQEYERVELTGTLAPGAQLVVAVEAQNGAPDGVVLINATDGTLLDALSYEGEIRSAQIGGQTYDLVEGTPLPATVVDSNTEDGSLSRIPNGADSNDAATDWAFTTTKTPGTPNGAGG